jgi:peptidoglycan/LPS O-acetylase OafA/YrhL
MLPYRPDIDGLRAVAVLAVVAYHAFPARVPGGFIGVDVFFVISGFLISQHILQGLARSDFSFGSFYARRVRRIFPALTVVLAAGLWLGWHALFAGEFAEFGKHVAVGAGFGSNFLLWAESGYFDAAAELKPLLHLWSLGIEEQFYIVWPLLLWLAWRIRKAPGAVMALVAVASFVYSQSLMADAAVAAFYHPVSRVWELAVGGLLAWAGGRGAPVRPGWLRELLPVAGLALVMTCGWWLQSTSPYPGWAALLPVAGCALVILAGPASWLNRRVLAQRALVFVGLISFPLYLWHWMLLSFLRIVSSGTASGEHRLMVVALSGVLASLTYLLVERPIRRRAATGGLALVLTMCLATVGAAGYGIFKSKGFPERLHAFE